MANQRMQAYYDVLHRTPKQSTYDGKISEIFGENVFHTDVMREYLPSEAFKSMVEAIESGARLDRKMADQVASAMKDWAITKGATHYTHWFQPLTGATAEKHDAFFETLGNGDSLERFEGNQLVGILTLVTYQIPTGRHGRIEDVVVDNKRALIDSNDLDC